MRLHNMFKKTGEKITSIHSRNRRKPEAPEGILKKCNKCAYYTKCDRCPGMVYMEKKDFYSCDEFAKKRD